MNRLIYSFSILLISAFTFNHAEGDLPESVLCNNKECTEQISTATTLLNYNTDHDFGVSFQRNVKVIIVAKPNTGSSNSLGIIVNGKFGFAPARLIKEHSILKQPKVVVDVESLRKIYRSRHSAKEKPQKPSRKDKATKQLDSTLPDDELNEKYELPQDDSLIENQRLDGKKSKRKRLENEEPEPDMLLNQITEDKIEKKAKRREQNDFDKDQKQEPVLSMVPNASKRKKNDDRDDAIEDHEIHHSNEENVDEETNINSSNDTDSIPSDNEAIKPASLDKEKNIEPSINIDSSIKPIENPSKDNIKEDTLNIEHSLDNNVIAKPINNTIEKGVINTEHSIKADNHKQTDTKTEPILENSTDEYSNELDINNDENIETSGDDATHELKENDYENVSSINESTDTEPILKAYSNNLIINHAHEENLTIDRETAIEDDVKTEHYDNVDSSSEIINTTLESTSDSREINTTDDYIIEAKKNTEHPVIDDSRTIDDLHSHSQKENVTDSQEVLVNNDSMSDNDIRTDNATLENQEMNSTDNTVLEATIIDNITAEPIIQNEEKIELNNVNINSDIKPIESPQIENNIDINKINSLYKEFQDSEQIVHENDDHIKHVQNEPVYTENDTATGTFDSANISSEVNSFDNSSEDDLKEQKYESPYHQPPPSAPPLFHGSASPHLFHTFQHDSKETMNDQPQIDEPVTTEELPVLKEPELELPVVNEPKLELPVINEPEVRLETSTAQYEKILPEPILNDDAKKSDFASSLFIFGDLYDSILKIYRSIMIGNGSDELKNLNNDFTENAHSSQNIMSSLFSETMRCSADDKIKPTWSDVSSDLIFWLVTSAVSVLMFTLGYYYLENRKQDGKLLAMVNSLQKELLCSTKECIILKEDLNKTKEILTGIEDSSFGSNEMFASLKQDLAESQKTIDDLEERLTNTEEELANSTEAAFELQSILNEQLVSNEKSSSLAFTVTQLQTQLDDQQSTMNITKSQLATKIEENEMLIAKIVEVNNKSSALELDLLNTQESLSRAVKENEGKSKQIDELTMNFEKSLKQVEEQKKFELKEVQKHLDESKAELNKEKASSKSHKHEIQSLQDSLKALQLDEDSIKSLIEVTHTNAEMVLITSEKALLSEKVEADRATIAELTENVKKQNINVTELKEQLITAERNALEATTRLEVLTNYFKEKEAELLKELNNKETMWLTQQGEAMSITEKIEVFQKQIQQYKETSESMRRDVAEQEAAWRARIAALEQRTHDEWLARRAAERAAEASAREAQALRQRLAAPSPDKRVVSPLTTGEAIPDPAFLPSLGNLPPMLPPPPLGFLPNPLGGPMMMPPPFPLPPHRPPPLGRLSSPPPTQISRQDRSYSPDSRYSPERDYSPHHRARSPMSNQDRRRYNDRRYDNNRYYDSEEERRSRRYETETDFSPVNTLPPSPIPNPRNHNKGISSGSGHSFESLERFK